jgi:hypothetical protein
MKYERVDSSISYFKRYPSVKAFISVGVVVVNPAAGSL